MKKWIALVSILVLVCPLTALASSPTAGGTVDNNSPDTGGTADNSPTAGGTVDDNSPTAGGTAGSSPTASDVVEESTATESSTTLETPAYAEAGFANAADERFASERGMSAPEYYNNSITSTPGVPDAMPVGQGGKIIINGVPTNLVGTLSKVSRPLAGSAQAQATNLGGRLLNVMNVGFPSANFNTATINFYLKGLAPSARVAVMQYINGQWVPVEVAEIRADHVVVNLTSQGAIAFVELSNQ